jgi:hypothetical protein
MSIEDLSDEGPVSVNPDTIKLDGEEIPESLRGKTLKEVLTLNEGMSNALKVSEQARLQAEQMAQISKRVDSIATPAPVKPVEEEPEMTREEIAALFEEKPLEAVEKMQEIAVRKAEKAFNQRFGVLAAGASSSLENSAKQKYGDEFAALGSEINAVIDSVPGGRNALTSEKSWDDLVAYVRGQNFDKMVEYKTAKNAEAAAQQAQAQQQVGTGFTAAPRRAPPPTPANGKLDAVQLEIAKELNMSPEEYIKWSNVG